MKKISSSVCSRCVHGMCMVEEKTIMLNPPQISDQSSIDEVMSAWDSKVQNGDDDDEDDVSYQHITSHELIGQEITSICYYPTIKNPNSEILLKFGPVLQCSHFEQKK